MSETDIAILFARNPLSISPEDFDRIVEKYRASRHLFNSGVRAPTGSKLTKSETEVKKLNLNIDLGDL